MLSRKTKYGLKALTYLARQEKNMPIQISTIASEENISRKFLESILLQLKKAGYLASKKGKGGGYYLLKTAEEVKIDNVYRILEGPISMVSCVSLNFYEKCDDCPEEKTCSVHQLMIQVRDNTLKIFEHTSIADLINKSK